MALAVGLYLYDSALLLYANEAVLAARRKGGWLVEFGSNKTTLRGKELYLPNPLIPTRPLFRMAWSFEHAAPDAVVGLLEDGARFTRFAPAVWSLFVLTFVFLPVVLFVRLGDWAIVGVFGLIYVNLLAIVLVLWFARSQFQLSGPKAAAMGLDLLLCPPFAINIIRRLSLRLPASDLVVAARRLQSAEGWDMTRAELTARLTDEIAGEEEGSLRMAALVARRDGLGDGGAWCPAPKLS